MDLLVVSDRLPPNTRLILKKRAELIQTTNNALPAGPKKKTCKALSGTMIQTATNLNGLPAVPKRPKAVATPKDETVSNEEPDVPHVTVAWLACPAFPKHISAAGMATHAKRFAVHQYFSVDIALTMPHGSHQ